jgi:hypothetical protein
VLAAAADVWTELWLPALYRFVSAATQLARHEPFRKLAFFKLVLSRTSVPGKKIEFRLSERRFMMYVIYLVTRSV